MNTQNPTPSDESLMQSLAARAAEQQSRADQAQSAAETSTAEAFALLRERAETNRLRKEQREQEEAEALREKAAAERAAREAWEARLKALNKREDAVIRARRSVLPEIPKATRASVIATPAYRDFLHDAQVMQFSMQNIPGYEEMTFPAEPTEVQVWAYALLPAFYWEYSDYLAAHPIKPSLLVKAWLNAMGVDSSGDIKGQRWVEPEELRYAIHNTAKGGYAMNPRALQQAVIKGRKDDKVDFSAYKEHYRSTRSGEYVFFPSVLLPQVHVGTATDWVGQTEYPYRFAFTNLKPAHIAFINAIIQHRICVEEDFTPAMGRWLAEQLVVIMGCFMHEGRTLTQEQLYQAAWRYSLVVLNEQFGSGSYYGTIASDRPDDENFDRNLLPPMPIVQSHQPDAAKYPDAE